MMKERVDVRVEPELLEELEVIAQRQGISSRSSAIREAVEKYVDDYKDGCNSAGLKLRIPFQLANRLEQRIINGDAIDLNDALKEAVSNWVEDKEDFHLRRKYLLDADTAENVKNNAAKAQLEEIGKQLVRK